MTKDIKIVPEEIHLFHIDVVESVIKEGSERKKGEFELGLAHTMMHNLKDNRVKIGLFIDLSSKYTTEDESTNAHFSIDFHYQVENLGNFYKLKDDGQPIFSALLITTLLGLSLSTGRGIIYEKLSNSNFRGIIIPVLDARKILTEKRNK
ncbi:MAG: hypothetical protein RSF34_12610 [Flavobacterium sp.]|uniref:hypothetical protein n=1 Tax=Flavobacterium sp. TaxID=239 RepID=UPI002FC9DAF6